MPRPIARSDIRDLDPERIVRLEDDAVVVLDQRRLPNELSELRCRNAAELAEAIRAPAVRGAPAIGIAAAYGMALAARGGEDVEQAYQTLAASRPTAVNLRWALDEMRADPTPERAGRIHDDEVERCRRMGAHAATLVPPGARILTHCNAGGLATGGYGSAIGAIRAAAEQGGVVHVWVDETRPLLQGARLTAFELEALGITYAVIVDGAAASRMSAGEVDVVITGADRIAANGDTANKIGTYGLAVLARHHGIPFVIVAPTSTIDPRAAGGADIPIEERDGAEVTTRFAARNPAFDVTPAALITAIVTEVGVHRAPYGESLPNAWDLPVILGEVDDRSREILERNGFDVETFERLRAALVDGSLALRGNVVHGAVEPPLDSDLTVLPEPGEPGFDEAVAAGTEALRAGRIAIVVLAGGMATRFGGGVKAVAEAFEGRSFLDVKLGETQRLAEALGGEIPAALMTSFATNETVRAHVAGKGPGEPLFFRQTAAPRLRVDGSLYRDADGNASLYGPGHGDVLGCIRSSGVLDELVRRGVRSVMVANVGNLAARLDPAVVGMHVLAGTPLSVEVVAKEADTGGAPVRVDGRPQLLEALCFPPEFDQSRIPVFNTNTSLITVEALREPVELTWLLVEKLVERETVAQFERLYHELSAHVSTTFLVVPRHGPRGRFLPVKEPGDLADVQPLLREMLASPPA